MPATLSRSAAASLLALHGHFNAEDLKKAYHQASLRCHPDKAGIASTEAFQMVQHAYELLQQDLAANMLSTSLRSQAVADDWAWFVSRTSSPDLFGRPDRSQWGFPTAYERSTRFGKMKVD